MHAPAPAPLSDQELLDMLSQLDQEAPAVAAASGSDSNSNSAAADWSAAELLADSVFGAHADFTSLLHTLSPSDDGAESGASSPGSSSPPSAKQSEKSEQEETAVVAKPSRKRRKHELDRLRALAETLESELLRIKRENDDGATPGSAKLFWKRVSDQRLVDRQKAMGENARLREVLRDQVRVVKSLQRSLAKSPDLNVRARV